MDWREPLPSLSRHTLTLFTPPTAPLHTRYQGVDWRDRSNWGCNGGMAPNGNRYYDGLDLDPYEVRSVAQRRRPPPFHCDHHSVMTPFSILFPPRAQAVFVKVKAGQSDDAHPSASARAARIDEWQRQQHSADRGQHGSGGSRGAVSASENAYSKDTLAYKLPALLDAVDRGESCFDAAFYLKRWVWGWEDILI